jgi:hypothetical protein
MSALLVTFAAFGAGATAIGISELQRRLETWDYQRHLGD